MAKYVMALDSGTTSNRCILFDESGRIRSVAQKEFIQHFPKPGWVEHDAGEIWSTQLSVAREAMNQIEATAEDIAAIGITNQRETTIVWDKNTGQPVYHAIVWQCRRTSEYCDSLKAKGLEEKFRQKIGRERLIFFSDRLFDHPVLYVGDGHFHQSDKSARRLVRVLFIPMGGSENDEKQETATEEQSANILGQ